MIISQCETRVALSSKIFLSSLRIPHAATNIFSQHKVHKVLYYHSFLQCITHGKLREESATFYKLFFFSFVQFLSFSETHNMWRCIFSLVRVQLTFVSRGLIARRLDQRMRNLLQTVMGGRSGELKKNQHLSQPRGPQNKWSSLSEAAESVYIELVGRLSQVANSNNRTSSPLALCSDITSISAWESALREVGVVSPLIAARSTMKLSGFAAFQVASPGSSKLGMGTHTAWSTACASFRQTPEELDRGCPLPGRPTVPCSSKEGDESTAWKL